VPYREGAVCLLNDAALELLAAATEDDIRQGMLTLSATTAGVAVVPAIGDGTEATEQSLPLPAILPFGTARVGAMVRSLAPGAIQLEMGGRYETPSHRYRLSNSIDTPSAPAAPP
jgi:hypothetical protein